MEVSHYIGFDIGGTKTRAILWHKGKILKKVEIPTPASPKNLKKQLLDITEKIKPKNGDFKVSVGAAGTIKNNSLLSAPNMQQIKNVNFRKVFPSDIPVLADNDARCFLRYEIFTQNKIKDKRVFGLTIGTGIGRALAENGKIKVIKSFERPEKWEKEYQEIRSSKNYGNLSDFLSLKIIYLINKYNPEIIFLGGGLINSKKFLNIFKSRLKKLGIKSIIAESKNNKYAGAVGAVLNYFS